MRRHFFIAILLAAISGCGHSLDLPLHANLVAGQPQVIAFSPAPGSEIDATAPIVVEFSTPIDEASLHKEGALVVTSDSLVPPASSSDGPAFLAALEQDPLLNIAGSWLLSPSRRVAIFTPDSPLAAGQTYSIVVSPSVMGDGNLPFNQTPGEGPTPYVASFHVAAAKLSDAAAGAGAKTSGSKAKKPAPAPTAAANPDTLAQDANPDSDPNTDESATATTDAAAPVTSTPAAAVNHPHGKIVINEIYYDAPTTDTDGLLFVKLFGTPGDAIGGFKIIFLNGDNGTPSDTVVLPDGALIGDDGFYVVADSRTNDLLATQVPRADFIDNFDPQNGPDSVQLVDGNGTLQDAIGYGAVPTAKSASGLPMWEGHPAVDVANGHSLSRKILGVDTDDNAADFVELTTPTPGR